MTTTAHMIVAVLLFISLCSPAARSEEKEPHELTRLRSVHEGVVTRAVKGLTETYVTELKKLQTGYSKDGKLAEALKVADEIRAITGSEVPTSERPMGNNTPPLSSTKHSRVTIAANTPEGYRIGPISRGDSISIQYREGKWKRNGIYATSNPDDPEVQDGDLNRLVISTGPEGGLPGHLIKIVPAGTAEKPFVYTFAKTFDDVVLRINDGSTRKDNPGAVTYSVILQRQ